MQLTGYYFPIWPNLAQHGCTNSYVMVCSGSALAKLINCYIYSLHVAPHTHCFSVNKQIQTKHFSYSVELSGEINLKLVPAVVVLYIQTIYNVVWVVSFFFFFIIFASRLPALNESLKRTVPLSSFLRKSELDSLNNSALDARHKTWRTVSTVGCSQTHLSLSCKTIGKSTNCILCAGKNHDKITHKGVLVPLPWAAWQQLLSSNPKVGALRAQIFHGWWTRVKLSAPRCS